MGALVYNGEQINFDDRVLTHLQIVIVQKFRRDDGFMMSWISSGEENARRTSIWLHRSIPMTFTFVGSRVPLINPAWISLLTDTANSSRGLIVRSEPANQDAAIAPAKSLTLSERTMV